MKEMILNILKESDKALSSIEISEKMNLKNNEQLTELLKTLSELESNYEIYKSNKNKYMMFENSHLKKGRLQVNKKGFGFVVIDGEKDDLYVDSKNMRGALNNDLVVVEPLKSKNKKIEGRIVKVLKKENNLVIGEFNIEDGHPIFKLDDNKLKIKVILDKNDIKGLVPGLKLEVSLNKDLGNSTYFGKINKIIGHKDDPGVDILSIVYSYGINDKFPEEVLKEIKSIPDFVSEDEIKGRRDLRDKTIFTIDGKDTKDIDDAISIEKKGDNYILGVHIADVSYYVKEGTALYKEAYERATSVYLVDRVIPMIPHKLSNGICSLNPNVDRLAISCEMEITSEGKIINHDIFESVINSKIQMNYESVNKILKDEEIDNAYEPYVETLKLMNELSKILRKERLSRGYLDFDSAEAKILVDDKGNPYDVVLRNQDDGEKLIEDFMIAANETVASHIFYMDLPFIYRIHEIPDNEKIKEFLSSISLLGYNVKSSRNFEDPRTLKIILDQLKEKEEFPVLSNMLLRCMKKAIYKEQNLGHYGLGSKCYTHFTSPIRRFPDTTVHNLLRKYLFTKNDEKELNKVIDFWNHNLSALCEHTSEKERIAVDCERDVDSMKMAEYMESHIGEEFDGIIDSILNFGMFIQLPNLIEGFVHISEIKGDYYNFNEQTKSLKGQRKGKIFKLGQKVHIKVVAASKENSTIDFEIIEKEEKDGDSK